MLSVTWQSEIDSNSCFLNIFQMFNRTIKLMLEEKSLSLHWLNTHSSVGFCRKQNSICLPSKYHALGSHLMREVGSRIGYHMVYEGWWCQQNMSRTTLLHTCRVRVQLTPTLCKKLIIRTTNWAWKASAWVFAADGVCVHKNTRSQSLAEVIILAHSMQQCLEAVFE